MTDDPEDQSSGASRNDPDGSTDGGGFPDEEEMAAEVGAGGARMSGDGSAKRAVTGQAPLDAAAETTGLDRLRTYYDRLTDEEQYATIGLLGFLGLLGVLLLTGALTVSYVLYLVALAGMYVLLSIGLNVQWGYTGLINFSVAAFFGVGAYAAALLASGDSPLTGGTVPVANAPVVGIAVGMLAGGVLAVLLAVPTLSLREDYLAIASLGLAEVVRIVIKNQEAWTGGSRGVLGMPEFLTRWPLVGPVFASLPSTALDAVTVLVFTVGTWLFVRRVHRSPWGRVQRLIRSDEDLAKALGKNTYRLRMQSFVLGSIIMALAGVFFVHLNDSVFPENLEPIRTFYVWIAVILGGAGSDRGAILGGIVVVTIVEGSRFLAGGVSVTLGTTVLSFTLPVDPGALRLFLVGLIIVLVMRFRPQGVLPPQRELIWPGATGGDKDE